MKGKKSSGCNDISCRFVKKVKDEISAPVSMLVKRSIQSRIVIKSIKIATVVTIYK